LLAVAMFGFLLTSVFNRTLDRRLDLLRVPAPIREQIDMQRPKLAAIETTDERGRQGVRESFVAGFHAVAWIAAILAIGSAVIAATMIEGEPQ